MPQSLAEWVQIITQIVTAITAVVMARLAWRTYLKQPEQEPDPVEAANTTPVETPSEITIFQTSKQITRLKASPLGLECHLTDNRPGKGGHQWTLSKQEVQRILNTRDFKVNPTYKANTGLFNLGKKQGWLYSKKLYPEAIYLEDALSDIMKKTIA